MVSAEEYRSVNERVAYPQMVSGVLIDAQTYPVSAYRSSDSHF